MSVAGLSAVRMGRMRQVLGGHVERGEVPGVVALVARRGEVHVAAIGSTEAADNGTPMRRDTIFRIASVTKLVAAAAAMSLVEECRLRLDDPIDELLPELADRMVLSRPDAPLGDTVPARRPITLRDLLTLRMGIGAVMRPPGRLPIQRAMDEADVSPGPDGPAGIGYDEWIARLGALPLVYQPGESWMYHTGSDVLGVLMARATGRPLEEVLAERVFEPLGMVDTGFHVPAGKLDRLAAAYRTDPGTGALALADDPRDSRWSGPPAFVSAGGGPGLVSTADDLLAFQTMLLGKGRYGGRRVLSRASVELMTTDQLTDRQKAENPVFFADTSGWGFGCQVFTRRTDLCAVPGRFGWSGGTGTSVYSDPSEDLTGILLTQRYVTSPSAPAVCRDFWTCAYQAIDD